MRAPIINVLTLSRAGMSALLIVDFDRHTDQGGLLVRVDTVADFYRRGGLLFTLAESLLPQDLMRQFHRDAMVALEECQNYLNGLKGSLGDLYDPEHPLVEKLLETASSRCTRAVAVSFVAAYLASIEGDHRG